MPESTPPFSARFPAAVVCAAIPLTLLVVLAATPLWGGYATAAAVLLLWRGAARLA